tara:strand:- start:2216 stop:2551 length:336 start_codon:yes stop_codon:yes gene_type:complete
MFTVTNNKIENPINPNKALSLTAFEAFTVSHTNVINIKMNGIYCLNVDRIAPDLYTCHALENINGNISSAIAVRGAVVSVMMPSAAVGNPNPAKPLIVPAAKNVTDKNIKK